MFLVGFLLLVVLGGFLVTKIKENLLKTVPSTAGESLCCVCLSFLSA